MVVFGYVVLGLGLFAFVMEQIESRLYYNTKIKEGGFHEPHKVAYNPILPISFIILAVIWGGMCFMGMKLAIVPSLILLYLGARTFVLPAIQIVNGNVIVYRVYGYGKYVFPLNSVSKIGSDTIKLGPGSNLSTLKKAGYNSDQWDAAINFIK